MTLQGPAIDEQMRRNRDQALANKLKDDPNHDPDRDYHAPFDPEDLLISNMKELSARREDGTIDLNFEKMIMCIEQSKLGHSQWAINAEKEAKEAARQAKDVDNQAEEEAVRAKYGPDYV
jgi:hypothetical protein